MPCFLLLLLNAVLQLDAEEHIENVGMAVSGIWTAYLMYKRRTTICFLYIPVWIMLLLFGLETIAEHYWL